MNTEALKDMLTEYLGEDTTKAALTVISEAGMVVVDRRDIRRILIMIKGLARDYYRLDGPYFADALFEAERLEAMLAAAEKGECDALQH